MNIFTELKHREKGTMRGLRGEKGHVKLGEGQKAEYMSRGKISQWLADRGYQYNNSSFIGLLPVCSYTTSFLRIKIRPRCDITHYIKV